MYLSQTAEYALRAAAHLATLDPTDAAPAKELAAETGIPVHYLSKLLRLMVIEGILTSRKGHGGGFRLAKPKEEIAFIDVLRSVGFFVRANHCAFGWGECQADNPCPIHNCWSELNDAVLAWSEGYNLSHVMDYPRSRRGGCDE